MLRLVVGFATPFLMLVTMGRERELLLLLTVAVVELLLWVASKHLFPQRFLEPLLLTLLSVATFLTTVTWPTLNKNRVAAQPENSASQTPPTRGASPSAQQVNEPSDLPASSHRQPVASPLPTGGVVSPPPQRSASTLHHALESPSQGGHIEASHAAPQTDAAEAPRGDTIPPPTEREGWLLSGASISASQPPSNNAHADSDARAEPVAVMAVPVETSPVSRISGLASLPDSNSSKTSSGPGISLSDSSPPNQEQKNLRRRRTQSSRHQGDAVTTVSPDQVFGGAGRRDSHWAGGEHTDTAAKRLRYSPAPASLASLPAGDSAGAELGGSSEA